MNNKFDSTEEEQEPIIKPYHYFSQQLITNVHHYYISDVVVEPNKYADMIFRIQTAGANDVVHIHLNTPGGVLETGVQLINAMQYSQAHIITSLEGEVSSLGTMIFLAANEFIVMDSAMMMLHNYTGGVFGKGHEQIAALEATTQWTTEFMHRIYYPFLTEQEIQDLLDGKDLYFHADDVRIRLIEMVDILEADLKAAEKALEESESQTITTKKTVKKKVAKKRATKKS